MDYIVSPYLRLYMDKPYMVFNFLTNKLQAINNQSLSILKECVEPRPVDNLINKYGEPIIKRLIDRRQILEYETMWNQHQIIHLEIETSTVCNWRCEYCPVRTHPKAPRHIDKDLFSLILDRALEYTHIKWILHSFNEPTIDPNFYFYIDEMAKRNLGWGLFTNGSGLDESTVQYMKNHSTINQVIVNIPSVDKETFEAMTGSKTYDKTIQSVHLLQKYGIDVQIIVMGRGKEQLHEREKIRLAFPGIQIISFESYDRIGLLNNKYKQNIHIRDKYLGGCYMLTERASISINGDILLCCNDYNRSITFGNLKNQSLDTLLRGKEISEIRKMIWGGVSPDNDFYCRKCAMMYNNMHDDHYKKLR